MTSKTLDVDTGKVTKKIDCCVLECSLIEDRIKKAASKQVEEQAKEEFDKKCAEIDKHAKSMYADLEKKLITRVDMQDKKLASMQQYITTLSTQLVAKIAEEKASREAV